MYERDEREPSNEDLLNLARVLKVSAGWLAAGEEGIPPPNLREISLTLPRTIPVISYGQATEPQKAVDSYLAGAEMQEVNLYGEAAERYGRSAFALRVEGEAMLPDFRPGDIVIVDPDVAPNPGNIVVAKLAHLPDVVLKKYRARGTDPDGSVIFELVPLNDDYSTVTVNATHPGRIIGTVVEHHRKLR
jgi:SOS-response transcriptional repressor LexA